MYKETSDGLILRKDLSCNRQENLQPKCNLAQKPIRKPIINLTARPSHISSFDRHPPAVGMAQHRACADGRVAGCFSRKPASYRPARCADEETRIALLEDLRLVLHLEGSVFLFGEQIIS